MSQSGMALHLSLMSRLLRCNVRLFHDFYPLNISSTESWCVFCSDVVNLNQGMGSIMKAFKFLVPFVLISAVTTAAASSTGSSVPAGGPTQVALAPVAMMVLPANRSSDSSAGETQMKQGGQGQSDEGDFNLALAGALMVGMVVLKRFSR